MLKANSEKENPARGPRGASKGDLLGSAVVNKNTRQQTRTQDALDYLVAEMRNASLRLRVLLNEIDSIGLALKAGLISGDMAIAHLLDVGVVLVLKGAPAQPGIE